VRCWLAGLVVSLGCLQASALAQTGTQAWVIVQESPLAGFQYHEGKAIWKQLRVNDVLTLTREPDNPYDDRAIRVDWHGHKLGYVPRRENAALAAMMDRGQAIEARIIRLQKAHNPWERIRFRVEVPIRQGR
jgi:hypothetical protein